MKTHTITTYSFSELSDDAKKTAIRNQCAVAADDFTDEFVKEDFAVIASALGFAIADIRWSGFGSQGDGASFTGEWFSYLVKPDKVKDHAPQDAELHAIADKLALVAKEVPGAGCTLTHFGRYVHEMTMEFEAHYIDCWINGTDSFTRFVEQSRALARWLYRQLQNDYDGATGEQAAAEFLQDSDYDFTADGKVYS